MPSWHEVFEEKILCLELNLHEARWGTLVCTCKELQAVRLAFMRWKADEVIGSSHGEGGEEAEDARQCQQDAALMSEALRDAVFWAYVCMLLRLSRVVDHLEHWFEACPCHYKTLDDTDPLHENKAFRTRYSCCMAGRRAPELSAGILDAIVEKTFGLQHAEILFTCSSLSDADQNKILKDFALGQARLEQFFQLKFSFWKTLPRKLCVLGHHSEDIARMGLKEAEAIFREHVGSEKHHPLTLLFFFRVP